MPFIRDDPEPHFDAYRADLAGAAEPAQAAIRALLQMPVPPDVTHAEVEVFMDEYGGSPAIWIYFKGRNTRVDHADPSIFAGRALELALGLAGYCRIDEDLWSDHEVQDRIARMLVEWVRDQWLQAGGVDYPIPVQLSVHDGIGGLKPFQVGRAGK